MNINIPWEDAPEWAEWAAMDKDGSWWWHRERPDIFTDCWLSNYAPRHAKNINIECLGWTTSLTKRPSDKQ